MKKTLTKILLCSVILIGLTGCGGNSSKKDEEKIKENKEKIINIIKDSIYNWSYQEDKLTITDDYEVTAKLYNVNHWYICGENLEKAITKAINKDSDKLIKSLSFECYDPNMNIISKVESKKLESNNFKIYDKDNNEINKTIAEGKEEFKALCNKYAYKEVFRKIENYTGKYAQFTGEVNQVLEDDDYFQIMMSVTKDEWGYYDDSIMVIINKDNFDERILEDDIITVYGVIGDAYTYETVLGVQRTIPSFEAYFGVLVK